MSRYGFKATRQSTTNSNILTLLILSVLALCGAASSTDQRLHPRLQKLERQAGLLIDTRPAPIPTHVLPQVELVRRQSSPTSTSDEEPFSDSTTALAVATTTAATTTTAKNTAVITPTTIDLSPAETTAYANTSTAAAGAAATTLPQVFDSNIGSNFTSTSCPNFLNSLRTNSTLQNCFPVSLLLTNSLSFFKSQKSFFSATYALDASCSVNYQQCNTLITYFATQITKPTVCGPDLAQENPLVQQTHAGLVAYPVIYQAACLKDSTQGNYCFATAVTNFTTASNVYPYYLALGTPFPGTFGPTCDGCLQRTMAGLANAAMDGGQPVSAVYSSAASAIDLKCGAAFVPATARKATSGAMSRSKDLSAYVMMIVAGSAAVMSLL